MPYLEQVKEIWNWIEMLRVLQQKDYKRLVPCLGQRLGVERVSFERDREDIEERERLIIETMGGGLDSSRSRGIEECQHDFSFHRHAFHCG